MKQKDTIHSYLSTTRKNNIRTAKDTNTQTNRVQNNLQERQLIGIKKGSGEEREGEKRETQASHHLEIRDSRGRRFGPTAPLEWDLDIEIEATEDDEESEDPEWMRPEAGFTEARLPPDERTVETRVALDEEEAVLRLFDTTPLRGLSEFPVREFCEELVEADTLLTTEVEFEGDETKEEVELVRDSMKETNSIEPPWDRERKREMTRKSKQE